ncbi:MAG: thiamine pyrophosphate-binding protein [Oscillospiraceae bacterium]|nr:thiamine pyrophosphate-binding protein [Oscillospiraceae bacterium]
MKLQGAKIILECFSEHGIDMIFGGGAESVFAADEYARAENKTGVILALASDIAGQVIPIAKSNCDRTPLVIISVNNTLNSPVKLDIIGITLPITKHSILVRSVEELADSIRKAFFIAGDGRKGVVLVDLAEEITNSTCVYKHEKPFKITLRALPNDTLDNALEMFKGAKKPLIYAKDGFIFNYADYELQKFSSLVDTPVTDDLINRDDCDLVLVLGTKPPVIKIPNVLHIDIDDADIVCDVKDALNYFISEESKSV